MRPKLMARSRQEVETGEGIAGVSWLGDAGVRLCRAAFEWVAVLTSHEIGVSVTSMFARAVAGARACLRAFFFLPLQKQVSDPRRCA